MDPTPGTPLLTARAARTGYAGTATTAPLTLRVDPGECVLLLGPNGSGKTTFLRAVLGLADVVSGHLHVATRRTGWVPQHAGAGGALPASAGEVVASGLATARRVALTGAARRARRAAVEDALDLVGLPAVRRRALEHLSGGQRRRVLLARALVSRPRLVLLDEPTTGVDAAGLDLLDTALAAVRDAGAGLLVVTHAPDALARSASRAVAVAAC